MKLLLFIILLSLLAVSSANDKIPIRKVCLIPLQNMTLFGVQIPARSFICDKSVVNFLLALGHTPSDTIIGDQVRSVITGYATTDLKSTVIEEYMTFIP